MLTGGVSYPRRHTPSTAKAVPLKVNCPEGAREATLGCPLWGGKGLSFIVVGIPVIIARSEAMRQSPGTLLIFGLRLQEIATAYGLAMTVVILADPSEYGQVVIQPGRRGQCRPPYIPIF